MIAPGTGFLFVIPTQSSSKSLTLNLLKTLSLSQYLIVSDSPIPICLKASISEALPLFAFSSLVNSAFFLVKNLRI